MFITDHLAEMGWWLHTALGLILQTQTFPVPAASWVSSFKCKQRNKQRNKETNQKRGALPLNQQLLVIEEDLDLNVNSD